MTKGDQVKVIAPGSAFEGETGRIDQTRPGPLLPLGVKLPGRRDVVWFVEKELELIS